MSKRVERETANGTRFAFPVALDVNGRRCLVIGGGAVGARKAKALADAGACVTIVAPTLGAEAMAWIADGIATHAPEAFAPEHLDGAFLVIAATDSAAVNSEIGKAAAARNVLVNLAAPGDGGETGDFVTMATVRRGDLMFAVTAGGAGPSLVARLRRELEAQYGPEWEPLVTLFGEMRQTARETIADTATRTAALRRLAERADDLLALLAAGQEETAREEALACLHP